MATTAPPSSPIFSFFHMDMQNMAQQTFRDGSNISRTMPPTSTMPVANKDLVFVHLNESTGPTQDINTRHQVRAHVMRDFQRKKHNTTKSKPNKRSLLPNPEISLRELDAQLGEVSSSVDSRIEQDVVPEEMMAMARLPDPQVIGMLEPFDTLPIAGSPRLQLLMHYYNNVLVNTLIPVNPKDKWFNYAITDPALFHSTMLHAAMHHRLVHGGNDESEQLQLKRDTIMMVNDRLQDPVLSRSDVTIGAVVCLVLLENQQGNVTLSNIHMSGLQRMVALRGGIDNLGLAGVLRRKILWADLCNAAISGGEPRFNLTPTPAHPVTDFTVFSNFGTQSSYQSQYAPDHTLQADYTCDSEFNVIQTSLRAISSQNHLEADITGTLSDSIYIAERHLFYLLKNAYTFPALHSPVCTAVGPPCFIAGQIYLYHTLRDFPFEVSLFEIFMQRLNAALWIGDAGVLNEAWEGKEQTLIWVLALGALASAGTGATIMRDQYVLALKGVCAKIGIESRQDFIEVLESVVWRDTESDLNLVGLWNEVQWGKTFESLGLEELDLDMDMSMNLEGNFGF